MLLSDERIAVGFCLSVLYHNPYNLVEFAFDVMEALLDALVVGLLLDLSTQFIELGSEFVSDPLQVGFELCRGEVDLVELLVVRSHFVL